nr:transmembrane GTPase fzo-like [Pocillopora verrucosa]
MKQLHENLNETVDKLGEELKKAISEDVAIVFVGPTSSGKSSLINALFRNRFLPVTTVQTTMCKIQVRPTADEWSVDQVGCEKLLLNQRRGREDVEAFLSKISALSNSAERKELNIDSHSVIQVKRPYPLCILPKNIVLIDTPGSKENPAGDVVVLDSCKEADILVAVMDVGSPSIHDIAGLLNNVNCQFNFGVFTKWDKVLRDIEEGKRQQLQEKNKGEFQHFVKEKHMVYFVGTKHFTKEKETSAQANDARNDFLRFETDLAQSAKTVKAQKDMNLIERAEDLTSKHKKDFEYIKSTLETREEYIDSHLNKIEGEICTLNEKQCSLKAVDQEAKKLIDLIRPRLREGKNNELIQELSNNFKSCPTVESENEVIDAFEKMIDGINTALQLQSEKVEKEYQERKDNLRSFQTNFPQQFLPPYEATLKDFSYSSLTDPYAYVTRDNF